MVSTVTEKGGREHEHLSFSETKPNGDIGKEGILFWGVEEVDMRAQPGSFLSLHWPDFLPKAGRTQITTGPP